MIIDASILCRSVVEARSGHDVTIFIRCIDLDGWLEAWVANAGVDLAFQVRLAGLLGTTDTKEHVARLAKVKDLDSSIDLEEQPCIESAETALMLVDVRFANAQKIKKAMMRCILSRKGNSLGGAVNIKGFEIDL